MTGLLDILQTLLLVADFVCHDDTGENRVNPIMMKSAKVTTRTMPGGLLRRRVPCENKEIKHGASATT